MIKDELEKNVDEVEEEVVDEPTNENIQNIDLSVFNKKKFSINGDPSKVIELDVSDLNIINRLKEQYTILDKLADKVAKIGDKLDGKEDKELLDTAAHELKEIDSDMRSAIDAIFDSPICNVCVPSGSMYDPIRGKFRYEILIDTLIKLYDDNLTKEMEKIQNRVSKHTAKYKKR